MRIRNLSLFSIGLAVILSAGLVLTRLYSHLLFHSIVELISVGVMWAVFILVWNTRRMIDNATLLFMGIAFFFIGCIQVLHNLAYFTVKDVGKGSRLGFLMVQGIVKAHRRDIRISSEPGKGTEVSVYLPLIDVNAPEAIGKSGTGGSAFAPMGG